MTTNILQYIPNWQRFVDVYQPSDELIDAFSERMDSISDDDIRGDIAKYINLELGILLLSHHEIDQKKIREILSLTHLDVTDKKTP